MMKYSPIVLALLTLSAHAGSGSMPPPQPQQPIQQSQMMTQGQSQAQHQTSTSSATSAGGAGGAGGSSTSQNALGPVDSGNSSSMRAYAVALPTPVFTPPSPISGCPQANSESHAWGVGWNFISKADSTLNTDSCTLIIVYNSLLERCQFESADKVLTGLTQKALPAYSHSPRGLDLTEEECRVWRAPPTPVVLPPEPQMPAPVCSLPEKTKRVARKPPAPYTCPAKGR